MCGSFKILLIILAVLALCVDAKLTPTRHWQQLNVRIAKLESKVAGDFAYLREELYSDFVTTFEVIAAINTSLADKLAACSNDKRLQLGDVDGKADQIAQELSNAVDNLETKIMASIQMLKRGARVEKEYRQEHEHQLQDLKNDVDLINFYNLERNETLTLALTRILELLSKVVETDSEKRTISKYSGSKQNCVDWLKDGHVTSGVYIIHPRGLPSAVSVYCDMETDGGGWLVFQRRCDGSVNFYRNWIDYRFGFGNISSEFWLGNQLIHLMTSDWFSELRIDLEDFENETRYETFQLFSVDSRENNFKLHIEGPGGSAGDCMTYHNGMPFSTLDKNNVKDTCSKTYKAGFWYKSCHKVNINGPYLREEHESFADGVNWECWRGYHYSLKKTEMKFRPKNSHLTE